MRSAARFVSVDGSTSGFDQRFSSPVVHFGPGSNAAEREFFSPQYDGAGGGSAWVSLASILVCVYIYIVILHNVIYIGP